MSWIQEVLFYISFYLPPKFDDDIVDKSNKTNNQCICQSYAISKYGIAQANASNKYGLFHKILITLLQDHGIYIVVSLLIQIWNNTYHFSSMWCVMLICGMSILIITLIWGISFTTIPNWIGDKVLGFNNYIYL